MMSRNQKPVDPDEFTADELAFLRSESANTEVKAAISDVDQSMTGVHLRAYRKVANLARAEADALVAVRQLKAARGEGLALDAALMRAAAAERRAELAEAETARKQNELNRAIASEAMAVHSGDD